MKKSATTAVAIMFITVTPALAKSTLGGIIFTDFYVLSQDKESRVDSTGNPNAESRTVSHVEVPNMSRLRARWSNEDKVGMYTELGLGGSQGSTGVKLRHAYGTWDISQTWQLMGGHSTSPFSPLFPSQTIGNNANVNKYINEKRHKYKILIISMVFEYYANANYTVLAVNDHLGTCTK
jgi:hypothetical protein